MFCYQCEQTAQESGCHSFGSCGKDPETAALQDLILFGLRGLSMYAHRLRQLGESIQDIDVFTLEGLFLTVTNVNFDPQRHVEFLEKLTKQRDVAHSAYRAAAEKAGKEVEELDGPATFSFPASMSDLIREGEKRSPEVEFEAWGKDRAGLAHLLLFGLKGMAAYLNHAHLLGANDEDLFGFIHRVLNALSEDPSMEDLLSLSLETGEKNLKTMELLDSAHTSRYGHPEPTGIRTSPVKGKAILVSGHDLRDLEELLKQTEDTGINIYTHGEMMPALAYPELKKYKHLVGNYGGAWQEQRNEFDLFPGAILMTTNCLQKPKETYEKRVFTCGMVGWPNVAHIKDRDFSPVIKAAQNEKGFTEDGLESTITIGFAHNAVMNVAETIVKAVQDKKIRHFFVVGGCDGAKSGRNYFTDFVTSTPKDTVVLTLGCGKYRFINENLGEIGGIPRLLDLGQCNDSYSAIVIAQALSKAFGVGVNELPLSLVVSWFEQKAVAVLLTLLHLGIKGIRLGPSLPAFVTPPVLKTLQETFDLQPITTVEQDLNSFLN